MKKISLLLLAVLLCLTAFVSCDKTPAEPVDTTDAVTTEPEVTTAPPQPVNVITAGATEYKVIRPEDGVLGVVNAASKLRTSLMDATGATISIESDWHKKTETLPEKAKEIVVGKCDRPGMEEVMNGIRTRDYIIKYSNERIYIAGGDDKSTIEAVEYFIENYVKSGDIVLYDNLNYINRYEYAFSSVSINNVPITDYKVVIPADATLVEKAAAENLIAYFTYEGETTLDLVTDAEAESEYEILVGNTNRAASETGKNTPMGEGQFVLAVTGSKVVMNGYQYMVGGAVSEFVNNYVASVGKNADVNVTTLPTTFEAKTFEFKDPDSAIILIGDGMGFNHVQATIDCGKINEFLANQLPNKGEAITASYSVMKLGKSATDSAAAGTALATGYKTVNSYLGLDYKGKTVQNIRELAASLGAKTAILTTDKITGATPAAYLAHINDRDSTKLIQEQIDELVKNNQVDYAISRQDSDDILKDVPVALWGIATGSDKYFSMIEAACIDKRSHQMDLEGATDRVVRYNKIIAYCIEFTLVHPDSALIITADHETGGLVNSAKGYVWTSGTKASIPHTNANVPVYAIGKGTEMFNGAKVQNTEIPIFVANKCFGVNDFGDK